ncbi:MAG: PIN domain-containing protein [Spirochaetaceae bacterium]|nr:MAG: PIN domain-containing protein [Spirochaetaceae bacterium]
MIERVLIDSDVVLDVATGRIPFVGESKRVLAHMEERRALGLVSAHSVTTMFYILRKLGGSDKALEFLSGLLGIVSVATEGHNDIVQAFDSGFPDFEDALQHQCARSNGCGAIVTRNTDDYEKSRVPVYTPREYLAAFGTVE